MKKESGFCQMGKQERKREEHWKVQEQKRKPVCLWSSQNNTGKGHCAPKTCPDSSLSSIDMRSEDSARILKGLTDGRAGLVTWPWWMWQFAVTLWYTFFSLCVDTSSHRWQPAIKIRHYFLLNQIPSRHIVGFMQRFIVIYKILIKQLPTELKWLQFLKKCPFLRVTGRALTISTFTQESKNLLHNLCSCLWGSDENIHLFTGFSVKGQETSRQKYSLGKLKEHKSGPLILESYTCTVQTF